MMMDIGLDAWSMFAHAGTHLADVEIVSADGPTRSVERMTYGEFSARTQQLMHGLDGLALPVGARVATLAWNSSRHLEAYFAVPCSGRVLHTLNLRLSPEELGFIVDDAADEAVLVDPDLVPLLEKVQADGGLRSVRHVVVLGPRPESSLPGLTTLSEITDGVPGEYERPPIDESQALGVCYTSGTTGRPKGVVYTHRSTVLHALVVATGAGFSIGPSDCTLPVVPMFHASAWGIPFAATMVGAKQVFLAGAFDGDFLVDLLLDEEVTISAGVPTVWIEACDALRRRGAPAHHLRHVISGGSRPPAALIRRLRDEFGIPLLQAWGMTETSPLASLAWPKHHMRHWDPDDVLDRASSQAGLPMPTIDLTIREEDGKGTVEPDGEAMGRLLVRGPFVVDEYLHGAGAECFEDGWFVTGDIAVGTPGGYFHIADRTKDLIKSGGEWISSVDMESALMAMPGVVEAAVIAIPDLKWQERPLACVVPRDGGSFDVDAAREHLTASGFAKWQLPDRFEVVPAIPRTSVGKFDKKQLRAQFADTGG